MFYIHQTSCVSPQQTFQDTDLNVFHRPVDQQLRAIEPSYTGIPLNALRRMSKAVRLGVGTALPILKNCPLPDGIIIGSANAGMEDCIHFLKQIVDYNEGQLTPGSFVQSTPNSLAAQLGIMGRNHGYNMTHVHHGHAFENAALDAIMLIKENPGKNYLLGAIDDISLYNYTISLLAGSYKRETFNVEELYNLNSPGSIAGEGSAMFLVNDSPEGALAQLRVIDIVNSDEVDLIKQKLVSFLKRNLKAGEEIDLFISGENGDNRLTDYYTSIEKMIPDNVAVARFKHMSGEYPTASAMALWLACYFVQQKQVPQHMFKKGVPGRRYKNVLIYNNYKGTQHCFMLVEGSL